MNILILLTLISGLYLQTQQKQGFLSKNRSTKSQSQQGCARVHQCVTPSVVTPSVVEPNVVTPSVVEPNVVTPSVVTPSVVEPNVVTPSVVTPGHAHKF